MNELVLWACVYINAQQKSAGQMGSDKSANITNLKGVTSNQEHEILTKHNRPTV